MRHQIGLYRTASAPEIVILRRRCWGDAEAQRAIDSLNNKYRALRNVTKNAVHSNCFKTTFCLEEAMDALDA